MSRRGSRAAGVPPSSILPPWWRRPTRGGRVARRPCAARGYVAPPLLNAPVVVEANPRRARGQATLRGRRVRRSPPPQCPRGGGGQPAAGAWLGDLARPEGTSFPPPQSSPRGGGGQSAAGAWLGDLARPEGTSFPPSSILPPWWRRPTGGGRVARRRLVGADVAELTRQAHDRYCRRKAGLRAWTGDHDDIDSAGTRTRT